MKKVLKRSLTVFLALCTVLTVIPFMRTATSAASLNVTLDPGHGEGTSADGTTGTGADGATKWGGKNELYYNLSIALYTRERLQQYQNTTVYMTRTTNAECPGLFERADMAKANGSEAIISIHNNSNTNSSVYGSQVYIANNNYRPEVGKASKACANKIMDRLVNDAGTHRKEIYSVDSSSVTYPDGSAADHYRVIRQGKLNGLNVAMIVECVFVSNESDVKNFLLKEEKLKDLGYAIADGIADYYGLSLKPTTTYVNTIEYSSTSCESLTNQTIAYETTVKQESTVEVKGWSVHSEGVEKYQWNVNNTSWGDISGGGYRSDVAAAMPSYTNCTTLNSFTHTFEASSLTPGKNMIYFRGVTKSGNYYDIATLTLNVIPAEGTSYMTPESTVFARNRGMNITAKGAADGAWVGLFAADDVPGHVSSYYWYEIGNSTKTFNIITDGRTNDRGELTPGAYKLYLFADEGYIQVASTDVTVAGDVQSSLDNPSEAVSVEKGQTVLVRGWGMSLDGMSKYKLQVGSSTIELATTKRQDALNAFPAYAEICSATHAFSDNVSTASFAVGTYTAKVIGVTAKGLEFTIGTFELTVTEPAEPVYIEPADGSGLSIDRTTTKAYLSGVVAGTTAGELLAKIENAGCQVIDSEGNVITGRLGTGAIVKLIENGVEVDRVVVVVAADLDGDGYATTKDLLTADRYYNAGTASDELAFRAADMDGNGTITMADISAIVNAIPKGQKKNSDGSLNVMYYNLYGYSKLDSIPDRLKQQEEMIADLSPDILCTQEFDSLHRNNTKAMLAADGYVEVPVGSNGEVLYNNTINCGAMFYRKDNVILVESGGETFPETVTVDGEDLYGNNGLTKSTTWGVFKQKSTGKLFLVVNSHFMWTDTSRLTYDQANKVRADNATRILALIERIRSSKAEYAELPVIFGGDLNSRPDSEACNILGNTLTHASVAANTYEKLGYYGCYATYDSSTKEYTYKQPTVSDNIIDHVYVDGVTSVNSYLPVKEFRALITSDHLPWIVNFEL